MTSLKTLSLLLTAVVIAYIFLRMYGTIRWSDGTDAIRARQKAGRVRSRPGEVARPLPE